MPGPTLPSIANKKEEKSFLLATEDGWDTTHILPEPGSQKLAICGRRPVIVWTRVWTVVYEKLEDVPACARCQAGLEAADKVRRPLRALIVDDNATDRKYVQVVLRGLGKEIQIEETDSARAALALVAVVPFDVIVSDYHLMGSETGVDLLTEAKRLSPASRRIIVTGDNRQQVRQEAMQNDIAHAVAIKTEGPGPLRTALLTLVRSVGTT